MSANATVATGVRGRKLVDPNETPAQKLQRRAGTAVTKCLDRIELVGNIGVDIKAYCKATGADPKPILDQILSTLQEKFKETAVRLQTGETSKSVFQLNV